jgi:hypothetical protein
MEIYANSRPQDGRSSNEDAFLIRRGVIPCVALCDGSGNAGQVAKRALKILDGLASQASAEDFQLFPTWANWTRLMDSALVGGSQSTFLAVAIMSDRVVGVCVGDSRVYLLPFDGEVQILTEEAGKSRLGSGEVSPFPIHHRVCRGDILLLMSDGAWTPLNLQKLKSLKIKASSSHFSEFPAMILDEAGRSGRADDMTVVAIRV